MVELIISLLSSLRPDLVSLTLALVGLGAVIKYRTTLANELIPAILIAVSFVICTATGWFHSSPGTGIVRFYDAFILGGLLDGLAVAAYAGLMWSFLHGLYKKYKKSSGGGQ